MADNTVINAGSGGDTLRTDDLGTVKVPVSKIITGEDGVDGGFVSTSNPFPVQSISGSQTGLLMGANPVAASNPLAISGSVGLTRSGLPISSTNALHVTTIAGSPIDLQLDGVPITSAAPLPVSGSVGLLFQGAQASVSNPIPIRSTADQSGRVLSGSTVQVVRYVNGNASASGSKQMVAPQGAGNRIRVLSVHLMSTAAVVTRFDSTGSAGTITNLSGYNALAANGGFVLPHNPHGWFETNANEGLNLDVNGSANCGYTLTWIISGNP